MPEYTSNAVQNVASGGNVLFTETAVPCTRGYVIHREGAGVITLRGIVNSCAASARYKVTFGANIAVPAGGTAGAISMALQRVGKLVDCFDICHRQILLVRIILQLGAQSFFQPVHIFHNVLLTLRARR